MSNKAYLDETVAGFREERDALLISIQNIESGITFLGTSADPFGGASKDAHLSELRRQVEELNAVITGHEANR